MSDQPTGGSILDQIVDNGVPAQNPRMFRRAPAGTKGMTLEDVVADLKDTSERKLDVVLNTRDHIELVGGSHIVEPTGEEGGPVEDRPDLSIKALIKGTGTALDGEALEVTEWAHRQISGRAEIPWKYYQRMMETHPELLLHNVREWWAREPSNRMARTLVPNGTPGLLRAWVSDRFRVLDNLDFALTVMEAAAPFNAKVHTCNVNTQRLYLQLVTPISAEIAKGDSISLGITARNSEVGDGMICLQPWVLRMICTNGMTSRLNFSQVHLGSKLETGVLSANTIEKINEATWAEARDWVRLALDETQLDRILQLYRGTQQVVLEQSPKVVVANIARKFAFSPKEANGILETYLRQDDETAFGAINAVTYQAQERQVYQRRMDFEEVGGELLETAPSELDNILNTPLTEKAVEKVFAVRSSAA